jgi:hypothetical protein
MKLELRLVMGVIILLHLKERIIFFGENNRLIREKSMSPNLETEGGEELELWMCKSWKALGKI